MNPGDDFILGLEGEQQKIFQRLHQLLSYELDLECKIRYKIPFYFSRSWICYLNPKQDDGVELVFLRGNELSNDQNILEARGRTQVKGIQYFNLKEINIIPLLECIQEALLLDETVPYKSKRKKKK